ncbi:MAG: TPM domain-containing protein [bacterium]|nr:TPM domain-containing protein [bacterium]
MAKLKFNETDLEQIKSAVKTAESKTSGEIATAFIKESDDYALYELIFAVACGFVYFFVMMFFTAPIEGLIKNMFWDYSIRYLLMFYCLSTFLVIGLFYILANIPFLDRLIVPRSVMQRKVNERAVRHFVESGVYDTKDRTGILIFISSLEHRVELLADKGINAKIKQDKWEAIVAHIIVGIKAGQVAQNLCHSISQCGDMLAKHFPIQADDVNELKDDIAVLEK